MTKIKKQNTTALNILKAAEEIFLEKGFEGASINDIAGKAQINKSLIYHHFESKENLWRSVKANMIKGYLENNMPETVLPTDSFRNFIEVFVTFRFEIYDQNPAMARLISWQRLEKSKDDLEGVNQPALIDLAPLIKEFQKKGEVRSNLDPEMVSYFIINAASMLFMDPPNFLKSNDIKKKQQYLESLIESLFQAFTNKLMG